MVEHGLVLRQTWPAAEAPDHHQRVRVPDEQGSQRRVGIGMANGVRSSSTHEAVSSSAGARSKPF